MDLFVKRPIVSLVISLALLLAGISAAFNISVIQFPKVESTNLLITTVYPGASADVVQGFVTDPVERVAMTVPGVDFVDSRSMAGVSSVTVWLNLNENSSQALAELTSRLNQIRFELPTDALDPSVRVQRADQTAALFYLDVQSKGWSRAEVTDYMSRHITPQLAAIDGVQRIGLEGGRNPAMRIWLDPIRLASVEVGADEVLQALRENNVLAAVGQTKSDRNQIQILTNATLQNVADFESLIVSNKNGILIRLRDVANIELGEDRGDDLSRLNQDSTVFISIWSIPGANAISIGDEVYKRLDTINQSLPKALEIGISYDATIYMRNALKEIVKTLLETVVLVGLVVLLLMGSFRTALVPLVTIPISVLGAIAVISMIGFTLNLLTILAIVLSVGLVVDDAIVVVENVARHMREGKPRIQAALISSRELLAPIIAMTLTLAAVYAPIGFVSGLTGALFREFAFTLAIAVLISGVVAITLSPIMSAYVSASKGQEGPMTQRVNRFFERLQNIYGRWLQNIFEWRSQTIALGLFFALLIVPFYMMSAKELAPVEDQGSIQMVIQSSPDSHVEYVGDYMQDVVQVASQLPGFSETWQVLSPPGGFAGIEFVNYAERDFKVQDLLGQVYGQMSGITGLRVLPILPNALPTAGQFDVEMVVQSSDSYKKMSEYTAPLIAAAFQSGHFTYADTDLKINQSQARLILDHDRIADLGLSVQQVSDQLAVLVSEQDVNRYDAGGKSYRVIPMVKRDARQSPQALLDLQLTLPSVIWFQ
ncbi:efflux RND transporter permease subunit [Pleionea sp. CnH1-48]|uniref:efflux RND transporter permease subunit n=1 Tax=Pleionea sp. CnH1-48 TaxID=2954494 RepID=UPI0020970C48|nr:efflux RND transporter permease subunit [Pleionea sp. CnH1-48]MCO7223224.1 efflux RND transporter permease subunit [Pleionea sp. CnH1-48]